MLFHPDVLHLLSLMRMRTHSAWQLFAIHPSHWLQADVDVLSYFLEEAGGDIAAAEAAYLESREAEKEGSEQG